MANLMVKLTLYNQK